MKNLVDSSLINVYLQPGEIYVSSTPAFVSTILGSCVSVTLFSPAAKAGAICHALLPSGHLKDGYCYVDTAVEYIFEKLCFITGRSGGFEVKLFGGSDVLPKGGSERGNSVGAQNIEAAHLIIKKLGLTLIASNTGGVFGRKIFFYTNTGEVFMRRVKKTMR